MLNRNLAFCALTAVAGAAAAQFFLQVNRGNGYNAMLAFFISMGAGGIALWVKRQDLTLLDAVIFGCGSAIAGIIVWEVTLKLFDEVFGAPHRRGTRQLSQELAAKQAADRAKNGAP